MPVLRVLTPRQVKEYAVQMQVSGGANMIQAAKETVQQVPIPESREGRYLAFAFLEKDHGTELEFAGWTRLKLRPDKPDYVRGAVNPWGCEIPVFDLGVLYGKGATEMTSTTCIVIFEHGDPYRYYFGIVVEEISNVINLADATENRMSPLLLSAKRHLSVSPALKN